VPGEEKLRALVVEDEPETALQLRRILEKKFPLEVETAHDCASARKKISDGQFDIVTLDFMLPDGRGLDFLEELTSADSGTRVIMVTGHGDEETAVRWMRIGAAVTFSTLDRFAAGRATLPYTLTVGYQDTFWGRGGRTPQASMVYLTLATYFRLWGSSEKMATW